MVVAAGEVAGVEDARVSRARVKRGKSTIRNSFIPLGFMFSEGGFKGVWTQRLRGEGNF